MTLYHKQFLSPDPEFSVFETAAVAILPFPYEGGVSYGKGAARAPEAIIDASAFIEFYDEILRGEPYRMGIATVAPPAIPSHHQGMIEAIYHAAKGLIEQEKFVVVLGGDHSISSGYFCALREKYPTLSAIQLDAHADLRDTYEGSPLSHACTMARIRDYTHETLHIGIRAISIEEAEKVSRESISLCTMHDFRTGQFDLDAALANLGDPTFVTVDVDAFDWSVIASTGTPEPGGFLWDEGLDLLQKIFSRKNVVGFDLVELSHSENDRNSPFAAAKLVYKMLGFKLASEVKAGRLQWPEKPVGNLFVP